MSGADRALPNILVTGTPGTGKTSFSEMLAEKTRLKHINVGTLVKDQELHSGWDTEFEAFVLDEDKVVDALEDQMTAGGCIVDHHSCDFFPERWFDLVIVLQCDNAILYERLERRKYSEKKIQENMQCEIMMVLATEANEAYREEIVHMLPSNNFEDLESNCERTVQWCANWAQQNGQ